MHKIDISKFNITTKQLVKPISTHIKVDPKTGEEHVWVEKTYQRDLENTLANMTDKDNIFIDKTNIASRKKKSDNKKAKRKCKCK
jgi:hypothetical protein